jgi:phenylacetate-CoA ligase
MTLNRSFDRRLKDYFLGCHYFSAFDLDDHHLDVALDLLDRRRIEHLWGYAASLYFFALRAQKRGWNRPLRSVVTWGDNLYPHYRTVVEQAFRTRVTDTYGVAEGIQISAQCEHQRYHIHSLDVIVEYVDDDGQPVPPGVPGNLILTRLHAGPMPLIRYRVGDVAVPGDQSPCACGRGFDVMERIEGRDTDVVITPSGNRLIVHFFTAIMEQLPDIDSFQIIQEKPESVRVLVVPRSGFSDSIRRQLLTTMQNNGAEDLEIEIELVEQIPLTAGGKRRYVINKLRQSA